MARNVWVTENPFDGVSGVTSSVVDLRDAAAWSYSAWTSSGTFELTPQVSLEIADNRDATFTESAWSSLVALGSASTVVVGPSPVAWGRFVYDIGAGSNSTNPSVAVLKQIR